ncbi:tripartite tricarboxylate transporter substrate binding protein [Comamonas piscis]|uniref:Tripartite tricarboxylate transporter substrate binding protein n=1 Tax=Comamonas piscis TaxID=1562974 RepID=A0A7G5ENE9_9BURK|nr:tripartite tricarboxylate transporter substrate binding protein [Comamonas piscis]QMV75524.1 tripartite tricarboxylate transporter substrate binding protein [Comamonas piscis]WSO34032.1 tripartite tricarboxylate transporter substrate binding protein [Comamonas piscis]
MQRRTLIQSSLAASALLLGSGLASTSVLAQSSWPTGKSITYMVPFPPGGNTDTLARVIAQPLGKALGTPMIIENKGGAGGSVGSALAARATPDGYTILGGTISSHAINVSLYSKLDYDPVKSFTPVAMLGSGPLVLVVPASSPYKTLADVMAGSKAKASSGGLTSASPGSGTSNHMALELLAYQTGVKFTHVPYKGSGPAVQDVMGGQVDMMFDTALVVGPHIQAGKLRPIAVTSSKRLESLPDVPTIAEAGEKGFDMGSWQAVFAPAGTPKAVVDRLHAEIMKIVATPEVQTRLKAFGMQPSTMTPAELAEFQKAEVAKWAQVIQAAGIKAD